MGPTPSPIYVRCRSLWESQSLLSMLRATLDNLYPSLPYPTLPYPTLPYPTLPYPTLPYPTLPYPTQPCPTLP